MKPQYLFLLLSLLYSTHNQAQQWQAADTFAFAAINLVNPDNSPYTGNITLIGAKPGRKFTVAVKKGFAKVKLPFNDQYTLICQGVINYKMVQVGDYPYLTSEYKSFTRRWAWVNFHYQNAAGEPIPDEKFYAKGIHQDTVYTAITNDKGDAKLMVPFEDAYSLSVKYRPDFEVIRARELGQPYTTINVKLIWKGSKKLEWERAIADSLQADAEKKYQAFLVQLEKDRVLDSIHNAIRILSPEAKYFEEILKLKDSKVIDLRNAKVPFSKEAVLADFKKNILDKTVNEKNLLWTGGTNCTAGEISAEAKSIFLSQINYFRRMTGVSDAVVWNEEKNKHCQECAMMCAANVEINHHPPANWSCYSKTGASACGYSNLSSGPISMYWGHIAMYIDDFGESNYSVGHRRWLLNPFANELGIGATTQGTAVAVFPDYSKTTNSKTRDEFVAWPPRGYVPEQIIYPRWSFGAIDGNFDHAKVEMLDKDGRKIKLDVLKLSYGYAIPTIVWEPSFVNMTKGQRYEVIISNVKVQGQRMVYRYWVEAV